MTRALPDFAGPPAGPPAGPLACILDPNPSTTRLDAGAILWNFHLANELGS